MINYKNIGISFIEIVVTMTILAILIGISFGSLSTLKIENNRQEAHSELINFKINIEQMAASGFVGSEAVTSVIEVANKLKGSNTTINSPNNYYTIGVSLVDFVTNSYTITAVAQGVQASKDVSTCLNIKLTISPDQDDKREPRECW